MTVKELKQRLEHCPDDAVVYCRDERNVSHVANLFEIHYDDTEDTVDVVIDFIL